MGSTVINHVNPKELNGVFKRQIKKSVHEYFPGNIVRLGKGDSTLFGQEAFDRYPNRIGMLQSMVARELGVLQTFDDNVLFLDIETDSADERWNQPLEQFFRLGQFAWGEGDVTITTDLEDVLCAVDQAETVVAHHGHNFDFSVLLGDMALHMTMEGRLFDTWTHASLVCPAPFQFTARNGHTYVNSARPEGARRWFSLDNLAFQFGLDGKLLIDDQGLKALAKKYGGFGNIPTDDKQYLEYAEKDVLVLREVARSLLEIPSNAEYSHRAQKTAALDAQMTRNGCLIDIEAAKARSAEQARLAQETLDWLVQEYDFPTEGKQPWKSSAGKQAIDRLMENGGAKIKNWPKTPKKNRSYSGDALKKITEGTELQDVGERLALIMGQRSLADQLLRDTHADGRIHPNMDKLQVSGRTSVTRPGVTTFGTRVESIEKSFFIPDPDFVFMEFDLSNADARCVAILSSDKEYAKRFLPGVDGHEVSGRLMFGDETYDSDPGGYRHIAKALAHAYSYGAGVKKLAATANQPIELAQAFVNAMEDAYPKVIQWQNKIRSEGETGWVTGIAGRKMPCDPERAWTQAPALAGQNGTSEFLNDVLLNLYKEAPEVLKWIKFPIHDALLVQLPKHLWEYYAQIILDCAKQTINNIDIFMDHGKPGKNWLEAMH